MDQHLVFAISREYGSGGREIGERLASELGIAYYDKLLLKRIAEESGLSGDMVEDFDEKPMRPLLLNPNSFFCGTDIEHPVACPSATHAAASHAWTRTAPATIATSPTRTGGKRATTTCASTPATWTRWERSP